FTQERLWLLQELSPESNAYNLSTAGVLEGDLARGLLVRGVEEVARRQAALRTVVEMRDGAPVQEVRAEPVFELYELSGDAGSDSLDGALAELSARMERPYQLGSGPMLRVGLAEVGPRRH